MSVIEGVMNQNVNLRLISESDKVLTEITLLVIIDEIKRADGKLTGYVFSVVTASSVPVLYDVMRWGNTDVLKNLQEHEQILNGKMGTRGNLSQMRDNLADIVNLVLSTSITTLNASKEAFENSKKER